MSRPSSAAWSPGAAGPILHLADDEPFHWQDLAACAEVGGDFWFPEKGGSTREAKAICGQCPVRAECLEYALEHEVGNPSFAFGIWGGLSERQRRPLIQERRRLRRTAA